MAEEGGGGGTPAPYGPTPQTTMGLAVLEPFKNAVQTAAGTKIKASEDVTKLQKQLVDTPAQVTAAGSLTATENPAYKAIYDQLVRAMSLYDSAAREHQKALADLADATQKEVAKADPTTREALSAQAASARTNADAAAAQYAEFQQAAPDRKAAVVAQQRATGIANDQAQLNLDFQRETDPIRRQALQQQLDQGAAAVQQAQADATVASQTVGTRVTAANQAVAAGDIANQTSTATLQDLLRRVRQAPTDEQALSALQTALDQGQANLSGTRAGTAGTEASTEAQRFTTQANKLGGLAGLDDYIAAQKDAISKGLISPDQADQGLVARISGTDVFNAAKAANDATMARTDQQISQRADETKLASDKATTLGGMADTGLGQFMKLNDTVQPGSDAAGRGLIGYLGAAQSLLGQFQPPPREASPALPPMLQSFAGGAAAQPAQPATAGHTITINIGGSAPGSAQEPNGPGNSFQTNEPGAPNSIAPQQQPALLDKLQPAMPEHVAALFGMNGQQPYAGSGIAEGSRR